jgi:O-antigen ligase
MVVIFSYSLGLVILLLLLTRYEYGLCSLAILMPFIEMLPSSPAPGINGTTILIGLAFFLALSRERVLVPRNLTLWPPIRLLLLVTLFSWVAVVVLGRIPEYDALENLFTIKRWFTFILLHFIFLRVRDRKMIGACLTCIWVGLALESVVAFYQYESSFTGRLRGTIGGNQNDFGTFMALYIIVGIMLFMQTRMNKRKIIIAGGIFLVGFGLVYSLSRGAYLTFMAALTIFMYYHSKKMLFGSGIVLGLVLLLGVGIQWLLPEAALQRFQYTFEAPESQMIYVPQLGRELEVSAASRIFYAQAAVEMFWESPIWGVGFGTYIHRVEKYLDPALYGKRNVAHNMFLQIVSELGILGLGAFIWLMIRSVRVGMTLRLIANRGDVEWDLGVTLISITSGLLVANLFGNRFFNGMIIGYYFIIVALATRSVMVIREAPVTEKVPKPTEVKSHGLENQAPCEP